MSTITPTTNYVATLGSTAAGYANFAASQPLATISSVVTSVIGMTPASSTAYTLNMYSLQSYNTLLPPENALTFCIGTTNSLYITVRTGYKLSYGNNLNTTVVNLSAGSWTILPSTGLTSITIQDLTPA